MKIDYSILLPFIRDDKRPYLDAAIEAYHGDTRVGYVKFEWISSLRMDVLPTVWHYAEEFTGWCLGIKPDSDLTDPDVIRKLWKSVRSYSWYPGELPELTMEEMLAELDKAAKRKNLYHKFEEFKTSIDYVYVGYSKVDDGNCWPKENVASYQRKGIGSTLYKLAAMWLAVNLGKPLHSSTLIKPCAIGVWDKMVDLGYPIKRVRRPETDKYVKELDYSRSPLLLEQARRTISRLPHTKDKTYPTLPFFETSGGASVVSLIRNEKINKS